MDEFKKQTKKKIKINFQKRRTGDMEIIVAKNRNLKKFIKWKPKYNDLSTMVKSCIRWEKSINN